MSWLLNLYETYQSNLDRVGKIELKANEQPYMLLPISHTTQTAHIEVRVTEDGEFHSAEVVDRGNANTVIPTTEESASRTSGVVAYPLHDKLGYVAGDYANYGGSRRTEEQFSAYIQQLQDWASSPYASPKVKSIHTYLSRRTLIRDLIRARILYLNGDQQLIEKWDERAERLHGDKPPLFSVLVGEVESAFVRFTVRSADRQLLPVWEDPEMYESFIRYYNEKLGDTDLCYVTGERLPITERHANKIRNAADKAKLISANDTSGFTFRGRFKGSRDAASISYEASQKAHNALKWLINRQGKIIGQRVFLVWGNDAVPIPSPEDDFYTIDPRPAVQKVISEVHTDFAREVARAIDGYRNRITGSKETNVNIIILDSATTGRMAVLYYRNMDKELYLDKLAEWHSTCMWFHQYRKDEAGNWVKFFGAPATRDIAYAAYGSRAKDEVVKGLIERMIPCIVDGRKVPRDIIDNVFRRASSPVSMEPWEWEKTLSIACALINREHKGGFNVGLNEDLNDRDYLFGRLLAVADVLERAALEEDRATNAIRYMNAFSRHPARTWATIYSALQPYMSKLGARATFWTKIIDEVGSRIPPEEFNNKPLSYLYLLGFYSQRHALYQKRKTNEPGQSENAQGVMNDGNA
jgi:CRISPR-associated protein Cas8c/Csd1, subtype I-C/DVULG